MLTKRGFNSLWRAVTSAMCLPLIAGFLTMASAMPPNPVTIEQHIESGKELPFYLKERPQILAKGIGAVSKPGGQKTAAFTGTFKALAILVEFSDKTQSANATEFDTLLFINQLGSLRHYYNEVSYGQLDVVTVNLPSSLGWTTAPQTYAYYCNGQNGTGSYPRNSQRLCIDAVNAVDALVDFSQYDNNGDGYVDALILIHTGPGAEFTQSNDDIWSHMWAVPSPMARDGKFIWKYSIQPEYWFSAGDMTCGVYCHEFGHILGLPDLYDTTPLSGADSYGIGTWSIMSYGSWNGPLAYHAGYYYTLGDYPAHPDAWCRIELGFAAAVNVSTNMTSASIINVEGGGDINRLWTNGTGGNEYFLLENRQKTGYDAYLPSDGLLIWHIDDTQSDNDDRWYPGHTIYGNYMVALEQADGLWQLENKTSRGDAGDPFPGSTGNTLFSPATTPNSDNYDGNNTIIAITNISPSASTMTADFQVSLLSGIEDDINYNLPISIELAQNYPNPFNPATSIGFSLSEAAKVKLTVYDILGRKIITLVDDRLSAGEHVVEWNGRNTEGDNAPTGIYLYELANEDQSEVRKMMLVK